MAHPYVWIAAVGGIIAFLMGYGVGMNDLANSFGTTYGAKILTLVQICIVASICEFSGSVSLGGAVTSTISGGIADPGKFSAEPYVFMYGMLCAGGAAFVWLALATWLVLPVSSTHSVCGGVIGFAFVYGGPGAVQWATSKDEFPFVGGVVPIIMSWFISPLLTGAVAGSLYSAVRHFVLRPENSVQRAIYSLPLVVGITFFLESFFVLYKGAENRLHWEVSKAAWVAAIIGAGAGALSCGCIPLLFRRMRTKEAERAAERLAAGAAGDDAGGAGGREGSIGADDGMDGSQLEPVNLTYSRKDREQEEAAGRVVNDDDGEEVSQVALSTRDGPPGGGEAGEDAGTAGVTIYASDAEYIYRYLQIFTAICTSFAHGASDVSNAVGPFAAIYDTYQRESVEHITDMEVPIWVLCIGGAGLVLGLSTFGVRLMSLMGEKLTVITPSRGFCAELSTALVVSFASGYGIPVSSTHCITGAVIAISILDVGFFNAKWMMVVKIFGGWVFTLFVTAVISAIFFAQGIHSPSVN